MSRRNLEIDTLRGLACLLLVTYHVIGNDRHAGLRVADDTTLRYWNDLLALLRMPLFSFLSGVVYAWRPVTGDYVGFVRGKVRRLLVPMLLVGTLFAVVRSLTPQANASEPFDWWTLHLLPVAHFWFLEALFIIFLLVAGFERLRWLSSPRSFALVWLAACVLSVFNPLPWHLGLYGAAYLLPFFLAGLGVTRFGASIERRTLAIASGTVLVASVALALMQAQGAAPSKTGWLSIAIGAGAAIFLLSLRLRLGWLAWAGGFSFTIFLFHTFFTAAMRIVLFKLQVTNLPLHIALGLAAGMLGPIALDYLLRRLRPVGPWMLGIKPRGEAVAA